MTHRNGSDRSPQPSQAVCGTKTLLFSPLQHTSLTKPRTEPFGSDWSWSEHVFLFFSSLFPSFTLWKMLTFQQRAEKPNPEYFPLENAGGKGEE